MPWLVAMSVLLAGLRAQFSGKSWMVFFEDDFYYYLKIGQNLAHGAGSTFNGVTPTNGYHPLWLLVVTAFSAVSTRGETIFWFVVITALAGALAVFFLARRLLAQMQLSGPLQSALAAYLAIYSLHLFYTGMEIILAIPLMFALMVLLSKREFWQRGFLHAMVLGLLLAMVVLARLDLILLAGLLALSALLNGEVRRSLTWRQVCGLAVGLLPLLLYFGINHFVFGTWFPVSGMAKQLKFNLAPTGKAWDAFYGRNFFNWLNMTPVHLGVLSLPFVWARMTATQRLIIPPIMAFPFVYLTILCCLSDWQIWLWYLYPLRASLCLSFIVFSMIPALRKIMTTRVFALVVMLIVLGEMATSKWWTDVQEPIYAAAVDIQNFAKTHPGVYAMGDRSGMVGYLLPYPVIQTEGLVMDRTFLEKIRRQEALIPVLKEYGVRYYVGTSWKKYDGCFHAVEPFQAGKTSARMLGDFCQPAVAGSQHEFFRTRIFDLDDNGTRR